MARHAQGREIAIDEAKLKAFLGQGLSDMAAAISSVMADIGHKLGFYKVMRKPVRCLPLNWRARPEPTSATCVNAQQSSCRRLRGL